MSMSSKGVAEQDADQILNQELSIPVAAFSYRDMGAPPPLQAKDSSHAGGERGVDPSATKVLPEQEVENLVQAARLQAASETESRLRMDYELKSAQQAAGIGQAIEQFQVERREYFSRVEVEVIQLALSIAAKILHREAQVDPMLVAALVRVAIDKLHDGSRVSVRVSPAEAGKWGAYLAHPTNGAAIEIIEDAHLAASECILETELGSANFSIEAQMKEVERGFFDLLAQRPEGK